MTDERMPEAEVYESELIYMPYAKSLRKVIDLVCQLAPKNSRLIDIMSGTGYLLGQIQEKRNDLVLSGIDIDPRYVRFAQQHHPQINFEVCDMLKLNPSEQFDVFTCTGALHHIPYDMQEGAVKIMSNTIHPQGFGIISDCYINNYSNELERKLAAAKMGYEYLKATMENGSTDEVTAVTIDILKNDVLGVEFKTSIAQRLPIFKKYFKQLETIKAWPNTKTEYGDYVTILRK